jgi:hypothetical protein
MCTQVEQVAPESTADALGMMATALAFLSAADLHALGSDGQREVLAGLGTVTAQTSAVRAAALAAFDAAGGPEADGCKNATAWLHHRGGMTKAAARGASRDSKLQAAHPVIADALAAGDISESFATLITRWTGKLPEDLQRESDCILITAAVHGCGEHELNILGAKLLEEYKQTRPDEDPDPDEDPLADRNLYLDETIDGAGKLRADLSPQATAVLRAVLDSLGKKRGPEDDRTAGQRNHDALQTALETLLAAGGIPQRHGTATHAEVLMLFSQLRDMDGASALEDAWLHSHTPGAPVFLTGTAAQGTACDATLIPVVTGCPDWTAVEEIIEIVLAAHDHPDDDALKLEIARRCMDFVSGPDGAASMLRRGLLGGPFAAPSLPLDIGYSDTIPPHIRKAVILRDRHCAWPGGCDEPPQRCDVHHLIPKSQGGETSLGNCGLFCKFHHLIAIHAWGWTAKLLPGGIWEARSPDGNTVYRSHAPPDQLAA